MAQSRLYLHAYFRPQRRHSVNTWSPKLCSSFDLDYEIHDLQRPSETSGARDWDLEAEVWPLGSRSRRLVEVPSPGRRIKKVDPALP